MEERLKAKKILDELLNFFIVRKGNDLHCEIAFDKVGARIKVQGKIEVSKEEVAEFSRILAEKRNPSLEDYYEELLGNPHHEISDYHLIGMMTDEVKITFQEDFLEIDCVRKF